jgi:hypothetical protein
MNKEFVPYEQALALKELGFNEPCFGFYTYEGKFSNELSFNEYKNTALKTSSPLYQQAFRWFRENHEYEVSIHKLIEEPGYMASIGWEGVEDIKEQVEGKTYEEAELACLTKLIEIVKNK